MYVDTRKDEAVSSHFFSRTLYLTLPTTACSFASPASPCLCIFPKNQTGVYCARPRWGMPLPQPYSVTPGSGSSELSGHCRVSLRLLLPRLFLTVS
jgi:hypothetical protein